MHPRRGTGSTHTLRFFYAQRQADTAVFRLRTNLDFNTTGTVATVSGPFD